MKIKELIDAISFPYRSVRAEIGALQQEELEMVKTLDIAKKEHYKNISHADYADLNIKIELIQNSIAGKEKYAEGLYDAREILLNINPETNISIK